MESRDAGRIELSVEDREGFYCIAHVGPESMETATVSSVARTAPLQGLVQDMQDIIYRKQ